MSGETNDQRTSASAWRLQQLRHQEAIRSAEVARLVHALNSFGPLPRASLPRMSHAERWRAGSFEAAVGEAIRQGKLRELPSDFLAANGPRTRRSASAAKAP
jgi:hypothetical protein